MRRTLSAIFIVLSLVFALAAFGVNVNTSWTYQGQLRRSGSAYNGTCNFQFSLWDAVSAGTQLGTTQPINSVNVVNGLFTVTLEFGDLFAGDARWLGTSVQCSGDGGFTPLDPRQPITAAPYALSLRPGARIEGSVLGTLPTLSVYNSNGTGFKATGGLGIYGLTTGEGGVGVYGEGEGSDSKGVFGVNTSGVAVLGRSFGTGTAIWGDNLGGGLAGLFEGPVNVVGPLTVNTSSGEAIRGTGPTGVRGISNGNAGTIGIKGEGTGTNSVGVYGFASGSNTAGVFGQNSGTAIWAQGTGAGPAIFAEALSTGYAGRFVGPVSIQGTLTKSAGTFQIDHPLDPANKFLSHSFVESPDMKNIYDGNITTDATGSATVTLPDYFSALNRDYRYQLTVLGQFAQAIVSREIAGNSFEIHTDKPGVKVSWHVTGIRQDAYAQEHPIVVEEFKPAEQQGMYLYPAGFGAGEEKRIGHLKGPVPAPGAHEAPAAGPSDQASK